LNNSFERRRSKQFDWIHAIDLHNFLLFIQPNPQEPEQQQEQAQAGVKEPQEQQHLPVRRALNFPYHCLFFS
jgi:hypothetical protein